MIVFIIDFARMAPGFTFKWRLAATSASVPVVIISKLYGELINLTTKALAEKLLVIG